MRTAETHQAGEMGLSSASEWQRQCLPHFDVLGMSLQEAYLLVQLYLQARIIYLNSCLCLFGYSAFNTNSKTHLNTLFH